MAWTEPPSRRNMPSAKIRLFVRACAFACGVLAGR